MLIETEVWRPIPGWQPAYEASNLGRIRSVERLVNGRIAGFKSRMPGRLLKPALVSGYERVDLSMNNRSRSVFVHVLVLLAFVGPKMPGMVACHADGNRTNNALANLRWDSQTSNMEDAARHGTIRRGEKNGSAKLTAESVAAIFLSCDTQRAIAERFGCSQRQVLNIKKRRQWTDVTGPLLAAVHQ